MDAETRHQLKQNELAAALKRFTTLNDGRTRLVLLLIVLALLAVVAVRFWRANREASRGLGWQRLIAALQTAGTANGSGADELRALIADSDDVALVSMARLRLGIALAAQAASDPGRQNELLGSAIEQLTLVADAPDAPATIAGAALLRMATAHETLREFDKAKVAYERLVNEPRYQATPFNELAQGRLETLDDIRVQIELEPGRAPLPEPIPPASQPASDAATSPSTDAADAGADEADTEPPSDQP